MSQSLIDKYANAVIQSRITADAGQHEAMILLQQLHDRLMTPKAKRSWLSEFLGINPPPYPKMHGVYLWGGVGRGKTMLMDMFYESLPVSRKWRVHFHDFMQYVHKTIHHFRSLESDNPLGMVIETIAKDYDVLCFDELQVHDIADASILSVLFEKLFAHNMTIIFTSNRPPEDLYLHGLQRDRFLPFIALLNAYMDVHEIQSHTDYRHTKVAALAMRYLFPLSKANEQQLEAMFTAMCSHHKATPADVEYQGRMIHVPRAYSDVAWFSFAELCEQPYGAGDYLELAEHYKVFFIADIPRLSKESRNEAKRFVTLIDVLYEAHATLCCTADAPAHELYLNGDGSFEFQRTISRLQEMMSEDY